METRVSKANKNRYFGFEIGFLPEKYHFAHSFCFFVHDLIVGSLVEGEKAEIFDVLIDDISDEKISSADSSKDIINWMDSNGFHNEALMLLFKQVIRAMISEFGHYTYEALNCSRKTKLSITFALLRKAFKDHLIYFEWLLGDPEDFMETFKNGKIEDLALEKKCEKRKIIIKKATEKLQLYWGTPEFLYEIRYDKKSGCSFESLWQKANHLITTSKEYRTEPLNFNFIFSTHSHMIYQWDILYALLPILMVHTYHVIESLLKLFSERANVTTDSTDLRVMIGFFLSQELNKNTNGDILEYYKTIISIKGLDKIQCTTCKHASKFTRKKAEIFFRLGFIKCNKCKVELNLSSQERFRTH